MAVTPSLNLILLGCLAWIFLTWIKRAFWVRQFNRTNPPLIPIGAPGAVSPQVSVIVPAKDEETNIGNCLEHLIRQTYQAYEIIVVDDRSSDRTSEIVETYRQRTKLPLRCVRIEKLPPGWTGKNYAMFTGSRTAKGEWLLFTDADTTHKPESIQSAVHQVLRQSIDFLTLAPETESRGFWEKTVQPLAAGSLALWFESHKVNEPGSRHVLANGQFILVRKSVYEKVGGNESVKEEVIEDVQLAKKIKASGFAVRFLNGTELYSTRMYASLGAIITGWTRIFTYLFEKNVPAILHKIFLFLFFSSLPFLVLLAEILFYSQGSLSYSPALFWMSLATCLVIMAVRAIGNRMVKTDPKYGALHLLGSFVMIWILTKCVVRIVFNRPSPWRGQQHT